MRKLDLTGQRFGKLTALRPAENIKGRTAWVCRCDCGQEIIARTTHLRAGRIKTCRSLSGAENQPHLAFADGSGRDWRKLDLTGQRFGSLTVLRPAENVGTHTAWVCRCDCGQESVVLSTCLRTGHTKTCGACLEKFRNRKVFKNNTSGVPGVEWVPRERRWKATICFRKKRYYLGAYPDFEDAVKARKQAEEADFGTFPQKLAETQTL